MSAHLVVLQKRTSLDYNMIKMINQVILRNKLHILKSCPKTTFVVYIDIVRKQMQIDYLACPAAVEDKLAGKHAVKANEARQILLTSPRFRFAEKGYMRGNDV
jgi:hypothetical protein